VKNKLKNFIEKYDVDNRLHKGFWESFKNYESTAQEEFKSIFGDYDDALLSVSTHSISYHLNNWPILDYEIVEAKLLIEYDEEHTGYYILEFDLNGEIIDDTLKLF